MGRQHNNRIELELIDASVVKTVCSIRCGAKCCTSPLPDFDVPVSMSEYRQLKQQSLDHYIDWSQEFPKLEKRDDGRCVFLNAEQLCDIYEIRPEACRKYPFGHLIEQVHEFCLLFHEAPEQLRQVSKDPSEWISIGEHLFDLIDGETAGDPIVQEYLDRYSSNSS